MQSSALWKKESEVWVQNVYRHKCHHSRISGNEERDLGVLFQQDLTFSNHAADAAKRANIKLGIIKRSFTALHRQGFLSLYKSIIRPTLENCNSVWCSMFKRDEDLLEKVQQRATRLLPELRQKTYPDRLKDLQLPTLAYRRQRADLIQIFKILKGFNKVEASKFFKFAKDSITRGHDCKIVKQRFRTKLRQFAFSISVLKQLECPPERSSKCLSRDDLKWLTVVNHFKSSLERHWRKNPLKFDPYQRWDGVVKRDK